MCYLLYSYQAGDRQVTYENIWPGVFLSQLVGWCGPATICQCIGIRMWRMHRLHALLHLGSPCVARLQERRGHTRKQPRELRVLLFKFGGEDSTWNRVGIEACTMYLKLKIKLKL